MKTQTRYTSRTKEIVGTTLRRDPRSIRIIRGFSRSSSDYRLSIAPIPSPGRGCGVGNGIVDDPLWYTRSVVTRTKQRTRTRYSRARFPRSRQSYFCHPHRIIFHLQCSPLISPFQCTRATGRWARSLWPGQYDLCHPHRNIFHLLCSPLLSSFSLYVSL